MIAKIITPLLLCLSINTGQASTTIGIEKTPKIEFNVSKSVPMEIEHRYNTLLANNFEMPQIEVYARAVQGFYFLKEKGQIHKDVLTIVDFSKSANTKRMWIIDMERNTIMMQTYVAHGQNSGEEFANSFSNMLNSNKSSLGFFATGETYHGKKGLSLRLDGLEKGLNDKVRARGVVVHGSHYVSEQYVAKNNRLGRSQGCPAIPMELTKEIIDMIKEKSCFFIYHDSYNNMEINKLFV